MGLRYAIERTEASLLSKVGRESNKQPAVRVQDGVGLQ